MKIITIMFDLLTGVFFVRKDTIHNMKEEVKQIAVEGLFRMSRAIIL